MRSVVRLERYETICNREQFIKNANWTPSTGRRVQLTLPDKFGMKRERVQ